jgi:aspartate 1-decarboxylase
MEAAGIVQWELVHVLDVTNGSRLETYAITGTPNSGEVIINGAAAHLVSPADLVIILAYQTVHDEDVASHRPRIVHVDGANRIAQPVASGGPVTTD